MAGNDNDDGWLKLGVAATLARDFAGDQARLLERLGSLLESIVPDMAEVERRGGLFSKKLVHAVRFTAGEDRYALEDIGRGHVRALRTHVVRGIALKTEPISIEEWLAALDESLEQQARTSLETRAALERFLG